MNRGEWNDKDDGLHDLIRISLIFVGLLKNNFGWQGMGCGWSGVGWCAETPLEPP